MSQKAHPVGSKTDLNPVGRISNDGRSMRLARLACAFAMASVLAALMPATTAGATDDFAVSLPADVIVGKPGEVIEVSMRVVNRSDETRKFRVRGVQLEPQDEGRTSVVTDGDSEWIRGLVLPEEVEVGPSFYQDFPVKLTVPANAKSDIHLVGIAVSPIKVRPTDKIAVENEAVNHIAIEVPGQARREAKISKFSTPRFVFGREIKGSMVIANTGDAAIRFRPQVRLVSAFSDEPLANIRTDTSANQQLLPSGKVKTEDFKWKATGLFSAVKPYGEVNYPDGNTMKTATAAGKTIIILPLETLISIVVVVAIVLLVATAVIVKRKIRKKRSS